MPPPTPQADPVGPDAGPASPPVDTASHRVGLAVGLLALAVVVVFGRIIFAEFTWWDDQMTIHHNPLLNPPTLGSLKYYWTTMTQGLYVPVTWTVWIVLARLAYVPFPDTLGITLNPLFFHAASVLCHLGSTTMAFFLLRRLLPREPDGRATLAALLGAMAFAVHPVQAETIGWTSGLKDMLCWLGVFGTTLLYVRRVQTVQANSPAPGETAWRSWELPVAALVMALAILSKPTAFVTSAILVAVDLLALRRSLRRIAIDVAPFVAISLAGMVVARVAQTTSESAHAPLLERLLVVGDTYCFYIFKWLWPATLTPDYGRSPAVALADRWAYVRWLLPAAIAVGLLMMRRRAPLLLLGGLLFAIPVAPVSGAAPFQMQAISTVTDHYLYFASFGVGVIIAWLAWRFPATPLRVALAAALVVMATLSWRQIAEWRDSKALFEMTMRNHPKSLMARINLVVFNLQQLPPNLPLAVQYADDAYALAPDNLTALYNYGLVHAQLGEIDVASKAFEKGYALSYKDMPDAYRLELARTIASIFGDQRRPDLMLHWADRVLALDPNSGEGKRLRQQALDLRDKLDAERAATRPTATSAPAPAAASRP